MPVGASPSQVFFGRGGDDPIPNIVDACVSAQTAEWTDEYLANSKSTLFIALAVAGN